MGLFDKKYCAICGEKIGLFGNKKLEDGNMCKDCAKKLSPWFEDRRHTDIAGIKEQLAYREQNKQAVAAFHITRRIGENMEVLIDEDARKFMVTDERDLEEANPDVLSFDDVTSCNLDVDESRRELYREGKDGERESYDPPRYEYSYRFKMIILVNNPYFDDIKFQLNNYTLDIEYSDRSFFGLGRFEPERDSEYRKYMDMGRAIIDILTSDPAPAAPQPAAVEQPVPAPQAPSGVMTCPWCGSKADRSKGRFCENCGGNLDG